MFRDSLIGRDMAKFSRISELTEFWLSQDIKPNKGLTENEIAAFEAKYSLVLPQDIREYFLLINGFGDTDNWVTDNELITFLDLDQVTPVREYWYSDAKEADFYFTFADYSLSAFIYAIHLSSRVNDINTVAVFYDKEPVKVANSFSEFIEGYLKNDHSIISP